MVSIRFDLVSCKSFYRIFAMLLKIYYIHYVILALPSSLFLMQRQKNHKKMYCKRKGKETFSPKQTRLAI